MPLAVPAQSTLPVLKVVRCRTVDGSGAPQGNSPASVHADVPATVAPRMAAYFVEEGFLALGPDGAGCSAAVGANASSSVVIRRPADKQAVVSFNASYSYGDVILWVCAVDPKAAAMVEQDLGMACPASPAGERITSANPGEASFTEAARVSGGLPHEVSSYRTVGTLRWSLGTNSWHAEVRACALPPADATLCAAVLSGDVRRADAEGWATVDVGMADAAPAGQQPPEGDIAVDASGADHVVFATADGVGYRTDAGGAWATAGTWPGFTAPRIAIGPHGSLVVAMVSTADGGVYVTSGAAGSLGAPVLAIPADGAPTTRPVLAVDGLGDVFVAAVPGRAGSTPSAAPRLAVRSADGAWSAPRAIQADGGAVALAGVPAGGARLAYLRAGQLRVATAAADGMVSAEQVLPNGFGTDASAIAVGPDGRAVVAGIAGPKVAVALERGGTWVLSPVEEADAKFPPTSVAVAVDPRTQKVLVLWDDRGSDPSFRLSRGPGAAGDYSWSDTAWLHPDGAPGPGPAALTVTANGSPHVLVPVVQAAGKVLVFEVATRSGQG